MNYINDMHKTICEKLGFDPIFKPIENYDHFTHEDDNRPESPLKILTIEELDFVGDERLKFIVKEKSKHLT